FRIEVDCEDAASAPGGKQRQHHRGRGLPDPALAEPDGETDGAGGCVVATGHCQPTVPPALGPRQGRPAICKLQRSFCFLQIHLEVTVARWITTTRLLKKILTNL